MNEWIAHAHHTEWINCFCYTWLTDWTHLCMKCCIDRRMHKFRIWCVHKLMYVWMIEHPYACAPTTFSERANPCMHHTNSMCERIVRWVSVELHHDWCMCVLENNFHEYINSCMYGLMHECMNDQQTDVIYTLLNSWIYQDLHACIQYYRFG